MAKGYGPSKKRTKTTSGYGASKKKKVTRKSYAPNNRPGGVIGMELKFFDSFRVNAVVAECPSSIRMDGLTVDPTPANCLVCPSQSAGSSGREGRNIQLQSIIVHGQIGSTVSNALMVNKVFHLALIQDNCNNKSAAFLSGDLFINPAGQGSTGAGPLLNLEQGGRFKVLKHKTYACKHYLVGGTATGLFEAIPFKLSAKLGGIEQTYLANSVPGVNADIADVSLHLVAWVSYIDDGVATLFGPVANISYNARTRYYG